MVACIVDVPDVANDVVVLVPIISISCIVKKRHSGSNLDFKREPTNVDRDNNRVDVILKHPMYVHFSAIVGQLRRVVF